MAKKGYLFCFCLTLSFLIIVTSVFAAQPVLLFSDLDSGPFANNGDTSDGRVANEHGAIVTVWGKNLGSTQGTSKIYIGGQKSPYVYYWGNATSPANVYVSHEMQKISFQVHKNSDSTGIYVVTSDGTSSTLPFEVRSGNIYFVDDSNAASGTGTYADPWQSPASYVSELAKGIKGATCYFRSGTYANTEYAKTNSINKALFYLESKHSGILGAPNAFIGYPNEIASFEATAGITKHDADYFWLVFMDYEQGYWSTGSNKSYNVVHYLTVSNLKFVVNSMVAQVRNHWRFVGNQCEGDPEGSIFNYGSGMIAYGLNIEETAGAYMKEAKIYGNVITGDTTKNKLNHAIYLKAGDGPDIGWNYMYGHDFESGPYVSMNIKDSIDLGFGPLKNAKIHDNLIDLGTNSSTAIQSHQLPLDSTVYIYNNVTKGTVYKNHYLMNFASGKIYLNNNTFYNDISLMSSSGLISFFPFIDSTGAIYYNKSIEMRNNIFCCINAQPSKAYIYIESNANIPEPTIQNNLYFGIPGGTFVGKAFSGSNSLIGIDPEFVNAAAGDFHLKETSPIKDAGVSTTITTDFDGVSLPLGTAYPIGVYDVDFSGDSVAPSVPQGLGIQSPL